MKERPKTIGEVSRASGVSPRTLRYYEERGLLRPARTEAGYRLYTAADERRLAHIMAMRSCGLPLTAIEHIMGDDEPNIHGALLKHLRTLRAPDAGGPTRYRRDYEHEHRRRIREVEAAGP